MNLNALRTNSLFTTLVLGLASASAAFSTTITLGGTASGTSGYTSSYVGASVTTFDNGMLPSNYSTTGGSIVTGSLVNVYTTPAGDSTPFLTSGSGSVLMNFAAAPITYLGFYWSTVDAYNSIVLRQANGTSETFTGSALTALGATVNGSQSDYVNFNAAQGVSWSSVTLSSTQNAFELDNVATATPEPASVATVGLGICLSLLGIARRRKKVAA